MLNKEDMLILQQYTINLINEMDLRDVKRDGLFLKNIKIQTKEICLEAVKKNGLALQFVKKQTKEICLEAVKQNIESLKYIDIKYVKFIYNYLKSINFRNLKCEYNFIKNKSRVDLIYCWGIKYVKQDLELCKLVVRYPMYYNSDLYKLLNYKKPKLCLQILKTFSKGFQYVNKQYIEIFIL